MGGFGSLIGGGLAVAISLAVLTSCRKPAEAVKAGLGEAGYQFTTADWLRASRNDAVPAMKQFVAAGIALDSRDDAGDSALHAAAAAGAMQSADFLMDQGLAVDLRGAEERTPLMAAVAGGQTKMIAWLLRQGADPRAKDKNGFFPLMLAVREGKAAAVAELAPYHRENLDAALLLAALLGRSEVIDSLTNFGASVYARMEDGRSPLMIAAENGHAESVKLLLDLGSSRFSTDQQGQTAAVLATAAGHAEIAALILREPLPGELALEPADVVAKSMDEFVDAAAEIPATPATEALPADGVSAARPAGARAGRASRPIQGQVLSAAISRVVTAESGKNGASPAPAGSFPLPPLVMRHYREGEMPLRVRTVEQETVSIQIHGSPEREVKIRVGESLPGSGLVVVGVKRRMESSKLNLGQPMEVSVVEIRDTASGVTREWISGMPATAHDPLALMEDTATGERFTATPGQRFQSVDGAEFIISDVRPNQIVIEDAASGAVQTIPLRGPRG